MNSSERSEGRCVCKVDRPYEIQVVETRTGLFGILCRFEDRDDIAITVKLELVELLVQAYETKFPRWLLHKRIFPARHSAV